MNITGYGTNNVYNNTNQKAKTQSAKQTETKTEENEFKNTKDYMEHLMKKYDCITKYNVTISEKALRKAINDPNCRKELERNLAVVSTGMEKMIKSNKSRGITTLNVELNIKDIGSYPDDIENTVIEGSSTSTLDPNAKSPYNFNNNTTSSINKTKKKNTTEELIRKNIEKRREENKKLEKKKVKKEEEEKLKEKLMERNREKYLESTKKLEDVIKLNNSNIDFKS